MLENSEDNTVLIKSTTSSLLRRDTPPSKGGESIMN